MKFQINKNAFQVEWQGKKEWVIVNDENPIPNDWVLDIEDKNIGRVMKHPPIVIIDKEGFKKITHSTIPNIGQQIEVVDEKDVKIQCKLI